MIGTDGHIRWRHLDTFLLNHPNGGRTICGIGDQTIGGFTTNSGNPIATMNGSKIQTWMPFTLNVSVACPAPVLLTNGSTTATIDLGEWPDIIPYYRVQRRVYYASPVTWSYTNNPSRYITWTGLAPGTVYEIRNRYVTDNPAYLSSLTAAYRWTTLP